MRIAILGLGREGKSLLRFLKKSPEFHGGNIEILDRKFHKDYLNNLERFNIIFRSPGIPYNLPELKKARRSGVVFSSATELFFRHSPCPIIGVTGTKGKGTTSTLVYKILRAGGKDTHLVGNIGSPALDLLPKLKKSSLVVFELSSFQLQDLQHSPHIAVVLDIFPDHQDAHRSLSEYYKAKSPITRYQKYGDFVFYFKNSTEAKKIAQRSAGKKIALDPKQFRLFKPSDLVIPGGHNFKNAVMAATVAQKIGVPTKTIVRAVKNFRGMEHRLEFVRTIGNVSFWNDSASTNPYTAAAAVHAFTSQTHNLKPKTSHLILIAGGKDKGLDYAPLACALKNSHTKLVVLFGENKTKIERTIKNSNVQIKNTSNLKTAVLTAFRFAKNLTPKTSNLKPIIIFSPGAASFDQFRDYAHRGEQFKKLVKRL